MTPRELSIDTARRALRVWADHYDHNENHSAPHDIDVEATYRDGVMDGMLMCACLQLEQVQLVPINTAALEAHEIANILRATLVALGCAELKH